MIALNIFNYIVVITLFIALFFTFLFFIEKMMDFISWIIIYLAINVSHLIIEFVVLSYNVFFSLVKLFIKGSLYYLIAVSYIYLISLIINVIVNISNDQNFYYIYNIVLEEQTNITNKICCNVYENYTI